LTHTQQEQESNINLRQTFQNPHSTLLCFTQPLMDYKTIQIEGLHNMQFIYNIEYIPKILIIV
jgi:hypothetical protein